VRVFAGNDAGWTQATQVIRTWPMKTDVGVKLMARKRGETLRAEGGGAIFGSKREEVTGGGNCLTRNYFVCTLHPIL